jgi:malonyl-CoA/methylmalonyl-CoA synthetase
MGHNIKQMLPAPPLLSHPRSTIIAPDGTFTGPDLDRAADRVAGALTHAAGGDLRESRVAFLMPPGFAYIAVLKGIWRAGGVAVPLAVSHPPAELEYVMSDADASLAIGHAATASALAPVAKSAAVRFLPAEELLTSSTSSAPSASSALNISPDRRALIVYTSGTTAQPKGVVSTHANLAAQIGSLLTAWEWTPVDRALLVLPLHHVHGIINVVGSALTAGAALEILPQFEAEATWERLASGEVTVFTAVPTIYRRLIQAWDAAPPDVQRRRSEGCRHVRLMMSGSAALPVATLDRWLAITGHTLLERYGMTELGMALSNPLHGERRPGHVGRPLPNVTTRIVDDAGREVAAGTPGELEVRGPNVFLEYWRRPDETVAAFRDGWFRTGDVAVIEDGFYRLLGRTSVDIIKTGGYKVSALEIEEAAREHPSIADCAVVGVADTEWGERVCAAVELRPDTTLTLTELQEWMKARLAPYKVPKDLRCVPSLPRNAMGKVVKPNVGKLFET